MISKEEFDVILNVLNNNMYDNEHNNLWDVINCQLLSFYNNSNMIKMFLLPNTMIDNDNNWINEFEDISLNENFNYMEIDSINDYNTNSNKIKIHGELDIILHPIYNIPSPYIRIWDTSGRLLNLNEIQSLLFSKNKNKHQIEILIDEHPVIGTPCYTFHICGINECIQLMDTNNNKLLKFVSWLSIIGRYIGLSINVNDYILFQNIIANNKATTNEDDIINKMEKITFT